MAERLRVGVIGVGGIAKTHMPGWVASPYTEVVAGCDVSEEVLAWWSREYDVDFLTVSPEELFDDPDIDIIDICTPNMYHAELTIAALEAGKHVLCEKPLAPTPDEIRSMIEARDRSGKMLMTAQHFRFRGISKALKAEIETGVLGDIYHARSWMLRRAAMPTRPGFILKKHSGGGATIDIGVHILDLTLWMMGNPTPVTVSGVARTELAHQPGAFSIWGGPVPAEVDVEELALAFVRFDNDATLVLEVSWMLHHKTEGEDMQMWLYGTDAGAHWPSLEIYQSNNELMRHYNRTIVMRPDQTPPHAQECMEFAEAIVEGKPSPVPAEQSLQVAVILDGIYRSQLEGREVAVEM